MLILFRLNLKLINIKFTLTQMEETIYNSYESTLKRLIQILKTKTTDNVKQLEDLWDSISVNQLNGIKNTRISPTISSSSQSSIHLSDSSNDSTNSISNNVIIIKFKSLKNFFYKNYLIVKKRSI